MAEQDYFGERMEDAGRDLERRIIETFGAVPDEFKPLLDEMRGSGAGDG